MEKRQHHADSMEKITIINEIKKFQHELKGKMNNNTVDKKSNGSKFKSSTDLKRSLYENGNKPRRQNGMKTSSNNENYDIFNNPSPIKCLLNEENELNNLLQTCDEHNVIYDNSDDTHYGETNGNAKKYVSKRNVKFNDSIECLNDYKTNMYQNKEMSSEDYNDYDDENEDEEFYEFNPPTMSVAVDIVPKNVVNDSNEIRLNEAKQKISLTSAASSSSTTQTTTVMKKMNFNGNVDGFIVNTQEYFNSTFYISCNNKKNFTTAMPHQKKSIIKFDETIKESESSTSIENLKDKNDISNDDVVDFIVKNSQNQIVSQETNIQVDVFQHSITTTTNDFSINGSQLFTDVELFDGNSEITERNKIISDLFNDKTFRAVYEYEIKLLRKYFHKWSVVTNIEKITGQNFVGRQNRLNKINKFLNKIRVEKKCLMAHNSNTHESRNGVMDAVVTNVSRTSRMDPLLMSKKFLRK